MILPNEAAMADTRTTTNRRRFGQLRLPKTKTLMGRVRKPWLDDDSPKCRRQPRSRPVPIQAHDAAIRSPMKELCQGQAPPSSLQLEPARPARAAATATQATTYHERCACTDGCRTQCLNRHTLTECHAGNCSSPPSLCTNRHFSAPPARALHVFDTQDGRGRGLQTQASLPAGAFVAEYTGTRRRWEECRGSCYRIDVGGGWAVDARDVETAARYINHSCDPNCGTWKWIGADGQDHIGIFAIRDLAADEELTISYGRWAGTTGPGPKSTPLDAGEPCLCQAANCVKVLWRWGDDACGW